MKLNKKNIKRIKILNLIITTVFFVMLILLEVKLIIAVVGVLKVLIESDSSKWTSKFLFLMLVSSFFVWKVVVEYIPNWLNMAAEIIFKYLKELKIIWRK